jgi:response regulator RpfG family c-di-GMP phosphodiesterase
VADLTVTLAQALEHLSTGPHAHVRFSAVELQELRYASLLHDFGKVGVREPVLVKAEKLYPHELEGLRARFQLARKDLQLQSYRRRLEAVKVRGDKPLPEIEGEEQERLTTELKKLDEVFDFILTCNRPTVLAQGGFERLHELGQLRFDDANGQAQPLLLPREIQSLSITRGTLSPEERREIASHVEHTYRFLSQIPWTRTLRRVPEIAYAHHEKMDGTGYPRRLSAAEIPLQSRMMTISDIFDALVAWDRPYKKSVPVERALDILKEEAGHGKLDKDLLQIFIEAKIYDKTIPRAGAGAEIARP